MKHIIKKLLFSISDKIVSFAEQFRNEKIYHNYNLDRSVKIFNVCLDGEIEIGRNTYINERSRIDSGPNSKIVIGRHCAIGRNVHITAKTHNLKQPTTTEENHNIPHSEENIVIGNYVWVGDNVVILPGINVADCAVIGANSVVNRNVSAFEIVGGIPIKHIRYNSEHIFYSN